MDVIQLNMVHNYKHIFSHLKKKHQVQEMEKVHIHTYTLVLTLQINPHRIICITHRHVHKCTQEHIYAANTDEAEEGTTYMCTQTWCTHRCNLHIQEDRRGKA